MLSNVLPSYTGREVGGECLRSCCAATPGELPLPDASVDLIVTSPAVLRAALVHRRRRALRRARSAARRRRASGWRRCWTARASGCGCSSRPGRSSSTSATSTAGAGAQPAATPRPASTGLAHGAVTHSGRSSSGRRDTAASREVPAGPAVAVRAGLHRRPRPDPARARSSGPSRTACPRSVTDRCRRSHEQVFHFTRQPRYYAAVDEIREPQHAARPWTAIADA